MLGWSFGTNGYFAIGALNDYLLAFVGAIEEIDGDEALEGALNGLVPCPLLGVDAGVDGVAK
ncbi:MAG TPA: hypothetical protein VMT30_04430 [Candidatus Saccharimonadia bacterium]|nr:hypothetical protein [Candidatus Saccharimonadia bacterium]